MADITKDHLRKEITAILQDPDLVTMIAKKVEEKLNCYVITPIKYIDDSGMKFVNSKHKKKSKKNNDSAEEEEDEDSEEDQKPAKRGAGRKKRAAKKATSEEPDVSEGSVAEHDEEYSPKKTKPIKTRKLPSNLSPELSALVGQDMMTRPEVVKKIWAIIKERNLYDPKNRQYCICDDDLRKVMRVRRFRAFGMMKYLKKHFVD